MEVQTKVRLGAGQGEWASLVPPEQWQIYEQAIQITRRAQAPFLLGGAFGIAGYTGHWRNTKDLDFFVSPRDSERVVQALSDQGFEDYYSQLPYDRGWINRRIKNGVLVDVIWTTPNRKMTVDDQWFAHAVPVQLRGYALQLAPPEEICWIKIFVLQKDRSDWTDLINLLYATGDWIDWQRLIDRFEDDIPLLAALLQVFTWACPGRARQFPRSVLKRLRIIEPDKEALYDEKRLAALDSRPWFAAMQPTGRPMII